MQLEKIVINVKIEVIIKVAFQKNKKECIILMNNLIPIQGQWDEGYILSEHMIKSQFIGYNESGIKQYDSQRTVLGELIYQFKYKQNKNKLPLIIQIVKEKTKELHLEEKIDIIIPSSI